jgi:hypothetical protein
MNKYKRAFNKFEARHPIVTMLAVLHVAMVISFGIHTAMYYGGLL